MNEVKHSWIMHVDMDAFFASIEQRDNPEYRNKAVIVGAQPGTRGVVSTCSYEARVFGVRSAMPISEAYQRCPEGIYVPPRMAAYKKASQAVMSALNRISPVVEQVSVDEAYVDLSGLEKLFGTPREIGARVKNEVLGGTGLSCSVGIGPNRLIAKLASEYQKPNGLTIVEPGSVIKFLDPMPVSNLRGVGKVTLRTLTRLGIRYVHQIRACSEVYLAQHFGDKGATNLYNQSHGIGSDKVGFTEGRKSLSKESTFSQDESSLTHVKARLRSLVAEVGRSLRKEGLKGSVVTLKLRYKGFETYTRQCHLPEATHYDAVIFEEAMQLLDDLYSEGRAIRLVGVGLSNWGGSEPQTYDLFTDHEKKAQTQRLTEAIDSINDKFGGQKLQQGVSVVDEKKNKES